MLFVNSSSISLHDIILLIVQVPLLIFPYLSLSNVVSKYVTFSSDRNGLNVKLSIALHTPKNFP